MAFFLTFFLSVLPLTTVGLVTNIFRSTAGDIPRILHIVGAGNNPPGLQGLSDAWQQFFPEPLYHHHYWDVLGPDSTTCFKKHFPSYLPLFLKQQISVRMASLRYCALFDSGGVSADPGIVVQPGFPHDLLMGGRVSMVNLPLAGTSQYGLFMASPRAHPLWRQVMPQVMQYFQQYPPVPCDGPDSCDVADPCNEEPCEMPSPVVVTASVPCQGSGPCPDQSLGNVVYSQVATPCSGREPCGDTTTPVVVAANPCDGNEPCDDSESTPDDTRLSTASSSPPAGMVPYAVGRGSSGGGTSSPSLSGSPAFQVVSFPMSSLLERVGVKSRMHFADCSRAEYIMTSYCSSATTTGGGTTTARTVHETRQYKSSSGGNPIPPPLPSFYYYPPIGPHPYPMMVPPPLPYIPYQGLDYSPNGASLSERALEDVKDMAVQS
ncbi:hypothetical protein Pmar_PMAR027216 [Perkinsus marinus ATCC 50983]|uniref:Uncharacterized protein n=1 Tax=Perkinsus marinus (strain ATCC 50983 / TXsc) TaxID=423536 RepID=C5LV55_PERM5|nr:hypothetical protein Pmar_PMAR027216 [Perkinsus marinus ATCC 50983]EEQ99388.1 hypothetical protein Pmar_PMAR027216 [Perkinsus marinus ATCC 50983]|eukprot:XP_002766671.1 hypothetical protein Pmar_PMAR027216 [Perkinsus marinus ATCC 50983]